MRWDTQQHMNMIWTCLCFYDFYTFLFAQFSQDFSDISFQLTVDFFSSVFRCKHYMVLTSVFAMGCAFYFIIFFSHFFYLLVFLMRC